MKKSIPTKIPTNGISANKRITLLIFCLLINILFTKTLLASTTTKNRDSLKLTQKEYLIKGKVYDEKGILMPGVTVLLDSTKIGVTTDMEGAFLLRLPQPKGNLVFSFIGYKTVKAAFEAGTPLIIHLKEDISKLDEVTVIAYGEQSRRNVIGGMSTVNADEIKDLPTPSLANLLQGRVAGMNVLNTTGAPGGGGIVTTIRGFNSLSVEASQRHSEPLWGIDWSPMYSFTSAVTGFNTL